MIENRSEKKSSHPRLFNHNELKDSFSSAVAIDRKKLVNIVNHRHFKEERLRMLLKHRSYPEEIVFDVLYEPCLGETLLLRPDRNFFSGHIAEQYQFLYLLVPFEQGIIYVPVKKAGSVKDGLLITLPETSFLVSNRKHPRFRSEGIQAELWQNGFQAVGTLMDFAPVSFRLRVRALPPSSFHWFNKAVPSQIRLYNGEDVLYSGNCRALYEKQDGQFREIVFSPADSRIQRFTPKPLRNPRHRNLPILQTVFEHPFTRKSIQHAIEDISTSGFSLLDTSSEIALFPGTIIPRMAISIAGILDLHCRAQVIHRTEDSDGVRFGIAILDMDLINYKKLFQMLNSVQNLEGSMFNKVALDELWEFFFDTDFIYPKKYALIQTFKDEFRNVYQRLYEESPDIASYFTYQKNGHIYGHISMIRSFEKAWLIHHLAARPMGGRAIGIDLLKKMIYFLNDVNHLPSANIDFIIAYFQPGNKFPERIFGGFSDYHGNTHHCSVDLFAYMAYPDRRTVAELPADWYLKECTASDLFEFEQFTRRHSDGLFPAVLGSQNTASPTSLQEKFHAAGFSRSWEMHILYRLDVCKAFILNEKSDIGLNLSNLLNGIKIFVADDAMDPEILYAAVSRIREIKPDESVSLMIYPAEYAYKNNMSPQLKEYALWILDMQYGDEFIHYLGRKFRIKL